MIGRIYKQNKEYYLIEGFRKYSIILDSKNNLKHGDLVEVDVSTYKNVQSEILSSRIKIKKSASGMQWPNINPLLPLHKRLIYRTLDLRDVKNHLIFVIKSEISMFFRKFFAEQGFMEVFTPTILGNILEGNVEKFKIDFYGRSAFLTMNRALYLRILTCSDFKNIYELGPVFVHGSQNTSHHSSEFLTFDWASITDDFNLEKHIKFFDCVLKNLLEYLRGVKSIKNEFGDSLKLNKLVIPDSPRIITYRDLIEIYLNRFPDDKKVTIQRHLSKRVIECGSEKLGNYFWVINFPLDFKQFYCAVDEDKKSVLCAELWWNKIKIGSVSLSDSDIKKVEKRIKLLKLKKQSYKAYLDAISYTSSCAVLGSINLERLLMVILGLSNI